MTKARDIADIDQQLSSTDSPTFAATTLTGRLTLPTVTYHYSSDGKARLYYYDLGDTMFRTADEFLFRNDANTTVAQISGTGAITATSFIGDGSSLTGLSATPPTMQVFTASGTWTRPAGCTTIKITITGGGAGGNDDTDGGTSGSTGITYRDVTALASATVTVGAGGAGSTSTAAGSNGGNSTWVGGGTITAAGGTTSGASVTGADINVRGSSWNNSTAVDGDASFWGAGGAGGTVGNAGLAFGSGGGSDNGGSVGGAGAPGVCMVEEFY